LEVKVKNTIKFGFFGFASFDDLLGAKSKYFSGGRKNYY